MSFVSMRRLERRLVDYIVSFFAVTSGCKFMFERKDHGLSKRTSDIIRLIGPVSLQLTNLVGYTS
jgi:hypothetical protein